MRKTLLIKAAASSVARHLRCARGLVGLVLLVAIPTTTLVHAQVTTFGFTGGEQTYTLPAGATGVIIQAAGAGGAGGGADAQGNGALGAGRGGSGGSGVTASGTYLAADGTQLKIFVGGGGIGGVTSAFGFTCATSAGTAGSAGGVNGFAGGTGGAAGCAGYSGGGGGGGGASVVSTAAGSQLVVVGGGGGGQGGSWESFAIAPSAVNQAGTFPPGSVGAVGASPGNGDGGGGGGGGGGCPGGVGGSVHNDKSGIANGTASTKGGSCAATTVTGFNILTAAGGGGGAGTQTEPGPASNPRGASGGNGSVILTPIFPTLNIAKSAPTPALAVGINSSYTLTVSNTGTGPANSARVLDQLPANLTYVSGSGTGWACPLPTNVGGTLVTCNFTGSIAATTGTTSFQITVTPTTNASVTNFAAVDPTGGVNPPVPTTCTAANAPSAGCAAPVTSSVALAVSGRVYSDTNYNSNLDGPEGGTGVTGLFIKLAPASGTSCAGPATVATAVNASTGTYSIAGVAQGSYCLILDTNNTLSDITPGFATGWIGTQNASSIVLLNVGGAPAAVQNFGKFNGSSISGIVFADTGVTSGTPNNGIKDGGEPGLSGVTVNATASGGTVASAATASDGSYTLWLPAGTGAVSITPTAPSGYLATGGSPGTSGGSYIRPSVSGTISSGLTVVGFNFGLVPPNSLSPNGAQTAQPGNPVFYRHVFQPASGGQVTFSLANVSTPASPAWTQQLYLDGNCNGAIEATDLLVSASITVTPGSPICLIVKQLVPAGAAVGTQNTTTFSAAFSYTNAAPTLSATLSVTDVTTVGQAGALVLNKSVITCPATLPVLPAECPGASISTNASPGDILEYKLLAINNGTQAVTTLVVSDATPAFTIFVAAACSATLPAGVTACSVSTQPAVGGQGGVQWTFTGLLASGAQVQVVYRVRVNQ